jgi:hypothetical protein
MVQQQDAGPNTSRLLNAGSALAAQATIGASAKRESSRWLLNQRQPAANAMISNKPKPSRPKPIVLSSTTSAAGHGNSPPETPIASTPRHPILPSVSAGGRWLWP